LIKSDFCEETAPRAPFRNQPVPSTLIAPARQHATKRDQEASGGPLLR
jgi:hypothetical protein